MKRRSVLAGACLWSTPSSGATLLTPASPADVASIDRMVAAFYESISGPAGHPRDWQRFRSLFVPTATFISIASKPGGGNEPRVTVLEDFITKAGPNFEKDGFFERELGRDTQQFGDIANIFSTYETRRKRDDVKPIGRGINSIQILRDGSRWWFLNVYWQSETREFPIPDRYLRKS
jgi:hypothetical protein